MDAHGSLDASTLLLLKQPPPHPASNSGNGRYEETVQDQKKGVKTETVVKRKSVKEEAKRLKQTLRQERASLLQQQTDFMLKVAAPGAKLKSGFFGLFPPRVTCRPTPSSVYVCVVLVSSSSTS